jgi:hypothetical protein
MIIKKLSLFLSALLVSCVFCNNSFAQSQTRSRAIYGELLGASQGIGFNYDARFKKDASDGFGWRTGLGFGYAYSSIFAAYNIDGEKIDTYNQMFRLAVPVEVNYLLGKGNSKFEAGAGAVLCADLFTSASGAKPTSSFGAAPYLSLGYRLVTSKGFLFRVGVLPSYNFSGGKFNFYPYLGFGWAF